MPDVDEKLDQLSDEWGVVYVALKPERPASEDKSYIPQRCSIRNYTDEGLPARGEQTEFKGETFSEALEQAVASIDEPEC